jgi:hypothetical protein
MKLKDYSPNGMNSSGSSAPNRAAKKQISKVKSKASKTELTMTKVINQVKHEVDTLLTLDELYTALSSLVMQAQPDADYVGITDANQLKTIISATIKELPKDFQPAAQAEVDAVRAQLEAHHYQQAEKHIMQEAQQIGNFISHLERAPKDIAQALTAHNK